MVADITFLLDLVNWILGWILSILAGLLLGWHLLRSMFRWMKKERGLRWVYLTAVLALFETVIIAVAWVVPELLGRRLEIDTLPVILRWLLLFTIVSTPVYFMGKKESGARGLITAALHILLLSIGWSAGKWVGIIFFSLSILGIFYWVAYYLAQVILPSSNPNSAQEQSLKFRYLFWYLWGLQYPIWVASDPGGRAFEIRVKGNYFRGFNRPGIITTLSHQVVGISTGVEFTKVGGPGMIFTSAMERPFAVVDLRTQIRTAEINAILSNGVPVKAIVLASFALDKRDWKRLSHNERLNLYRANPTFVNKAAPDNTTGSYPYDSARVRAALGRISVQAPNPYEHPPSPPTDDKPHIPSGGKPTTETPHNLLYWDEWVTNQVERAAKLALSSRTLDQLWSPKNDDSGANALDEIGEEVKLFVTPVLQAAGIEIFTARVVNFIIDENDDVAKQQVTSWKSIWEQRESNVLAKAEADSLNIVERARAHSQSMLLETIAQSLKQAREVNNDMPRRLIALHYITALEQMIMEQPGETGEKLKKRLKDWRDYLLMGGGQS